MTAQKKKAKKSLTSDLSRSLALLVKRVRECVAGDASPAAVLFRVNPVPASRPRVTRWGTYYGKLYKAWMEAVADVAKENPPGFSLPTGPLFVINENVIEKPRTSERQYPRGDVDNYAKAALDAITKNKLAWGDDDQVVALLTIKRFASPGEQPHTNTKVIPL